MLRDNPALSVVIVGHSDNQGSLEANIALSQRRAEAVRAALVERGVEPERLEAHGIGFLAPVTSNAAPDGKALNRRVELVLR
jgi:OOP family OmpA-OmpF porin